MRAAVYARQSAGKTKSIQEQLDAGRNLIDEQGWEHVDDYKDGTSASRYATKARSQWEKVLDGVKVRAFDVLVLWESSRGDRTLSSWATFLELCGKHLVRIYVISHDRLYDPNNAREWKTLAEDGVSNAYESEVISMRAKRGHAGAAKKGLPPGGPTAPGYRHLFDPLTGKLSGQVIVEPGATTVRRMFELLRKGEPVLRVAKELGMTADAVRRTATNRVYIGKRVHRGVEHDGTWEPMIPESTFYAVQEYLKDPSRKITRPGRQKHLLSYLGTCGVCGEWLNQVVSCYRCVKGCVSIPKEHADTVVTEAIIARLSLPNAAALLADNSTEDTERAEAEASRLRTQLDEWRRSAIRGQTTPASLAVIEAELTTQIEAAEAEARTTAAPSAVQEMLEAGGDARQRWEGRTLVARRRLVKEMCEIRVGRGRPGRYGMSFDPVEAALVRLGASRWHGSELTWAEMV